MFVIIILLRTKVPLMTKNKKKRLRDRWAFSFEKLVVTQCP